MELLNRVGLVFLAAFCCFCLLKDADAVRRPDFSLRSKMKADFGQEEVSTSPPQPDMTHHVHNRTMTARRCCKVGEKVAKVSLPCRFDIHIVSKARNIVPKARYNYGTHGTSPLKNSHKMLALQVTKCSPYKAMFEKCCYYRNNYIQARRHCATLKGQAKKDCRQRARQNYRS